MTGRVPGLIVGHAAFARSLLDVAVQVAGPVDDVPCLTNAGKSPEELTAEITAALDRLGAPVIVLVDLAQGSCWNAARRAARDRDGVHLVAGPNMAMLLTYLQKRDELGVTGLVECLLDRGRRAMLSHPAGHS